MAASVGTEASNLPYDVLFHIFSYLPIPDLSRCAATCPQWQDVVRGFPQLWRGKRYLTGRTPRQTRETYDILNALPELEEVFIEEADEFAVDIVWPRLILLVYDIWSIGSLLGNTHIETSHLTTSLDIVKSLLSNPSVIEFEALQKLRIIRAVPTLEQQYALERNRLLLRRRLRRRGQEQSCCRRVIYRPTSRAEDVITETLVACPNLKELSLYAEFMSGQCLDLVENVGQLRVLQIECPGLDELSFLQHCSENLEELELKGCADLESAAYGNIRHLHNLRRLHLRDCYVTSTDMEVAATGLGSLNFLQVDCCELVSNVSYLHHCEDLRELRLKVCSLDSPLTGLQHLPPSLRVLWMVSNTVTADELLEVLPRLPELEELNLGSSTLSHLRFLRHCPQLRRLCLEFCFWTDSLALQDLEHLRQLEALDLTRCAVNADILCYVLPLMKNLETLNLSHAENVNHLRFLRQCDKLRSLSLFYSLGMDTQAFRELRHLTNLRQLCVSDAVYDYVREMLKPCLPNLEIHCLHQFK